MSEHLNKPKEINVERLRIPNDLPKYQPKQTETPIKVRAPIINGEFIKGPIPLNWLSTAIRLGGKGPTQVALAILFESGRKKSATVKLTTEILDRFSVQRRVKYTAIEALETAGLIKVTRRGKKNPLITVLPVPSASESNY